MSHRSHEPTTVHATSGIFPLPVKCLMLGTEATHTVQVSDQ